MTPSDARAHAAVLLAVVIPTVAYVRGRLWERRRRYQTNVKEQNL